MHFSKSCTPQLFLLPQCENHQPEMLPNLFHRHPWNTRVAQVWSKVEAPCAQRHLALGGSGCPNPHPAAQALRHHYPPSLTTLAERSWATQSDSNCGPRISARSGVSLIYHTLARETESKQLEVTVAVCQSNLMLLRLYRCALLYYCFGNWRFMATLRHCPNSMCSLHPSVSHVGNALRYFKLFLPFYLLWWSVVSDLWCYSYDLLKAQMMVNILWQ